MQKGMNILIFEDNTCCREKLEEIIFRRHLQKYPDDKIILSTNSPRVVSDYAKASPRFTVYLLDIIAEEKTVGFTLAKQIKKYCPNAPVIFVTGHADVFITKMKYKLLADNFIFKDSPLLEEELMMLLRHFTIRFKTNLSLQLKRRYQKIFIKYDDIYYFETIPNMIKIKVVCKSDEYEMHGTLAQLQKSLDNRFQRVSRFYIVNTDMINEINLSTHQIILKDSYTVPYSNTYFKGGVQNADNNC